MNRRGFLAKLGFGAAGVVAVGGVKALPTPGPCKLCSGRGVIFSDKIEIMVVAVNEKTPDWTRVAVECPECRGRKA